MRTVAGGSLNSLLIEPVQRIPRYSLLLNDILSCTRKNHRDRKFLQQAAVAVKAAAQHCDAHVEMSKKMNAAAAVVGRIRNSECLPPATQVREVIREGS